MGVLFEWDPSKEASNFRKHGISFPEAVSVFFDPLSVTIPDPSHGEVEVRFLILGLSQKDQLLTVVHTDRGDSIRIISARRADRKEKRQYEDI
jgi:uncharacterized DUF497 family protein